MDAMIYEPLEAFETRFKALHLDNTQKRFEELVQQAGIDIEQNRQTVRAHHAHKEDLAQLRKKLNWLRFWRVLMCISLVLIPLVITKMTPQIRALRTEIAEADKRADQLLKEAHAQMLPLTALFTDRESLTLVEETVPLLSFETHLSSTQVADMKVNYDFNEYVSNDCSAVDVLAGNYNSNPFLFEKQRQHTMGTATYHGTKTIYWTESYIDSDGRRKTRQRSETLEASVTKPKPYYKIQTALRYCAQGGDNLSFSRNATHLEKKSENAIERYVKRGEKQLKKKTDKAIRENDDFTSMSNTTFEVLFDALDRTDEVQYRTLFTPLAQTNMVDLLLSEIGYGDNFDFIKAKRTNTIVAEHNQNHPLRVSPEQYQSYEFDTIKKHFIDQNVAFFKSVYFAFAPLWSIPLYQERPSDSLKPIPPLAQHFSLKEYEVLANAAGTRLVAHPRTQTDAVFKAAFLGGADGRDLVRITAFSYDIEERVDYVSVYGGDGRFHDVPVRWDHYVPLEDTNEFYVSATDVAQGETILSAHDGLCIYRKE